MTSDRKYDVVVVGAGIAGLATAELFARDGLSVLLLEKNQHVCSESSGAHHEWFHFGSLYAIFPSNDFMRTLVGGIDDLLAYYSDFPGMNLRVDQSGGLQVVDAPGAWIRDEPIEYIVTARNDPDFSLREFNGAVGYSKKLFFLLTWEFAIKQFISRHQRFHSFDWRSGQASEWVPRKGWWNYSRDVIFSVTDLDAALDRHTHFRVPGFDRPMNSSLIVGDLLRSFLEAGGELRVGTSVRDVSPTPGGGAEVGLEDDRRVHGRHVVITSGRTLNKFLEESDARLKVVSSPLLVVYPAVCRQNFVRLTPFPEKTMNHLRHSAEGRPYSLIGGSYFANLGDEEGGACACRELVNMAQSAFPEIEGAEVVEPYESCKVEMTGGRFERNYQYHVKELEAGVYAAVPGKFSLGFSLALDLFKKITGRTPPSHKMKADLDVSIYLSPVRHKKIVLDYLAQTKS